jgi:glutamine synthetase
LASTIDDSRDVLFAGIEDRKRDLIERGVLLCLSSYVDVHGTPKAKAVPIEHFERMLGGSELFTGAALDGLGQGPNDDELSVHPDLAAITILPWNPEVAWAPGPLYYHGEPYPMDSRTVLQRQLDRATSLGYSFNLGVETELYLVRRGEDGTVSPANPRDTLTKAAYDVGLLLDAYPFVRDMASCMNALGWGLFSLDHEDANSQFEFDWAYADAMTTADRVVLFKMMARAVADRYGSTCTFMPKPYSNRTGTGAHYNMSLASIDDGLNLFDDELSRDGLSRLGHRFIGGIIKHAAAVTAVLSPTVNSYKRLIKSGSMTGFTWAPVYTTYGRNNRTNMLRIPLSGGRVECRTVDGSCNPYLAAAMLLAAGLDGIENDIDPGPGYEENLYEFTDTQLASAGIEVLPRTLHDAVECFAADPLSEAVCGPDLAREFVDLKTAEWWDCYYQVTPWEIDRYLTPS